jgi:two-component system, LytTR family, sensor kinase
MPKSVPTNQPGAPAKPVHRVIWFLQLLALYAVIAALFATERTVSYLGETKAPTWAYSFSLSAAPWASWLLFTPLVVYLARRYPLEGASLKRSLLVHAGAAIAIAPLQAYVNIYIGVVISIFAEGYRTTWHQLLFLPPAVIASRCIRNPLIYAIIVGITSTVDYYRKFRERELRAAQLEGQLASARLHALQSQIHPHFLFNTLNAVTALMRQDVNAAERMLVRLADLLRLTLKGGDSQEVPLRKELDLLEAYLDIERIRFADRLKVFREIDPLVLDAPVPRLLLQPLAENAIRHGLAPKRGEGTLWIRARPDGDMLELTICDDGVGLPGTGSKDGVGLGTTRVRLITLYGEAGALVVSEREGGGVAAIVRLPMGKSAIGSPVLHQGPEP